MPCGCTLHSVPELQIQEMLSAVSPPHLDILTSQFSHSAKQEISKADSLQDRLGLGN